MGGITFAGNYVENASSGDNLAESVDIQDSDPNFVEKLAQRKPLGIAERVVDWIDAADEALFARYGQDWWTGVLYKPARLGLLGPTAKRNMTYHGDRVHMVISSVWGGKERIYRFVSFALNVAYGGNEKYETVLACASQNPAIEERLDALGSKIRSESVDLGIGFGKRILGGAFVSYATRGGKYGNRLLGGKKVGVGIAQIPMNMVVATWGAWIRMSTRSPDSLDILKLVNVMLSGSTESMSITQDEYILLLDTAERCGAINEEDAAYFYAILKTTMDYYNESK